MLTSSLCVAKQLQSKMFREWKMRMNLSCDHLHRKIWEYCYIAQALEERGMLQPGRRGLGFAVGREPLPSLFATYGCQILATDLDEYRAKQAGWVDSGEHASGLEALNHKGICPSNLFRKRVQFRIVDMNRVPDDLREFDFVWSSCSVEHLGSLEAGFRFMRNMTRCLRPGGVAVHTTEYNVSSNDATLSRGHTVLFRKRDLLSMRTLLESQGHHVAPLDFDAGNEPADLYVDEPPFGYSPHLKLRIGEYAATSIGMIVTAGQQVAVRPRASWGGRWQTWFHGRKVAG